MTPGELADLGSILNRLVPAIKAATGVQRVYFLALMERPTSTSGSYRKRTRQNSGEWPT